MNSSLERPKALQSAFNFGPDPESNRTVAELVQEILKHWPGRWEDRSDPRAVHEAKLLSLSIEKARKVLGWSPAWRFEESIARSIGWYHGAWKKPAEAPELTRRDIADYCEAAGKQRLPWMA